MQLKRNSKQSICHNQFASIENRNMIL